MHAATGTQTASPRPSFSHPLLPLQRKLAVGSTTDPLEAEADAAADAALESGGNHRAPRASRFHEPALTEAPPLVHQVLRSPGQELDSQTRNWAEGAFQRDFHHVRIHTGEQAEASAAAIHARAYTVGPQIVMGAGAGPSSASNRPLMAHELAHVVQQERSGDHSFVRRQPDSYAGTDSQGATGSNTTHPGTSAADTSEAYEEKRKRIEEQKERDKFAKEIQETIQQNMQKAVEMLPLVWLVKNSPSGDTAKPQQAATNPKVPASYLNFAWYLTQQPQTLQIMLAEAKLSDYIAANYAKTMPSGTFSRKYPGFHPPICTSAGDFADLTNAFVEPEDPSDIFKPKPAEARAPVGPPGPTYEEWKQAEAETLDAVAESPVGALLYYIGLSRNYGAMDMARFTSAGPVLSGVATGIAGLGQSPDLPVPDQRPQMMDESKSAPARTGPLQQITDTAPSGDLPKTPLDDLSPAPAVTKPMKAPPGGGPRGTVSATTRTVTGSKTQDPEIIKGKVTGRSNYSSDSPSAPQDSSSQKANVPTDAPPQTARDVISGGTGALTPGKSPLGQYGIDKYGSYANRPKDKLAGHEMLQNLWLEVKGFGERLDSAASRNNPAVALTNADHAAVGREQSALGLLDRAKVAAMTALENIELNAQAMKNAGIPPEVTEALRKEALRHAATLPSPEPATH